MADFTLQGRISIYLLEYLLKPASENFSGSTPRRRPSSARPAGGYDKNPREGARVGLTTRAGQVWLPWNLGHEHQISPQ